MNLLSFLRGGANADDLSWVLQCLRDSSGEWGMRQMAVDRTSEDMLVAFGLVMTAQTGMGLVQKVPSIVPHIGPVVQQVRAFYECLWQLDLLRRCQTTEDRAKVSRIYPLVQLRTAVITKRYFVSHQQKTKPFMCAFDGRYEETLIGAVREYIQGDREIPIKETGNLDMDNSVAFTFKIGRAAGICRPDMGLVHEVVRKDASEALALKFLTRFDFENCKAIELPPSWYKQ